MAWITTADVIRAGAVAPVDAESTAWLQDATDAANAWAWRQRQAAGYTADSADVAPSADVATATALYALGVYRARGTYGGAPTFDGMGAVDLPAPSYAQVLGLLGVPRMAVG